MIKTPKLLTEKFSKILLFTGLGLFIISFVLFLWNDWIFDFNQKVNSEKISQFGDLVGGLIGSIWALAGVILFYIALNEQRKDFTTNREVLNTQADALKQQIKEFELQRQELVETRKIYQIQSDTLKLQQFEATFFNLINLHHQIVNSIDLKSSRGEGKVVKSPTDMLGPSIEITKGRDCFVKFTSGLYNMYGKNKRESGSLMNDTDLINKSYLDYFEKHQSDLGHYFRNLYHIIKFIKNSAVEKKETYIGFIRAQLSNDEQIMLFYNCVSDKGRKDFLPMAIEFNLFKNLNPKTLFSEHHLELQFSIDNSNLQ
jgi:hypothetical protein